MYKEYIFLKVSFSPILPGGSTEPSSVQEYGLLHMFFILSFALMVTRIGPKWSTSNSKGTIEPIRDTIKSTLVAIWIEKRKNV